MFTATTRGTVRNCIKFLQHELSTSQPSVKAQQPITEPLLVHLAAGRGLVPAFPNIVLPPGLPDWAGSGGNLPKSGNPVLPRNPLVPNCP